MEGQSEPTPAVNQITPMLAYWDKYLVCRFANDAYLHWFGKHRRDMVNKMTISELLGQEIFQLNLPYIEAVLQGEPQTFERKIPVLLGKGKRYSRATYFPHVVDSDVKGFFVHVADITEMKLLEQELTASYQTINEQDNSGMKFANIVDHNLKTYADILEVVRDMFTNVASDSSEMTDFLEMIFPLGLVQREATE